MLSSRRYLTFSLRSLFILLTALAVWLGVVVNRAREQREAVEAIEALGGIVQYDWQAYSVAIAGGKQVFVSPDTEPNGPAWLRRLIGDDYFQEVEIVALVDGRPLTDSDILKLIPHLQRMRELRVVEFLTVPSHVQSELAAALPKCELRIHFPH